MGSLLPRYLDPPTTLQPIVKGSNNAGKSCRRDYCRQQWSIFWVKLVVVGMGGHLQIHLYFKTAVPGPWDIWSIVQGSTVKYMHMYILLVNKTKYCQTPSCRRSKCNSNIKCAPVPQLLLIVPDPMLKKAVYNNY